MLSLDDVFVRLLHISSVLTMSIDGLSDSPVLASQADTCVGRGSCNIGPCSLCNKIRHIQVQCYQLYERSPRIVNIDQSSMI